MDTYVPRAKSVGGGGGERVSVTSTMCVCSYVCGRNRGLGYIKEEREGTAVDMTL